MNLRRHIDELIKDNKTEEIKKILKTEKSKTFPTPMRKRTQNGRLSTAAQACMADNVEILADVIRYNKGISNRDFWICLKLSLLENKIRSLRFLLKLPKKEISKVLNNPPQNFEPPLFYARSKEAADLLLKNGADINIPSNDDITLLEACIQSGDLKAVQYLRQNGAFVRDMKQVMHCIKANRISAELYNYLQPTPKEQRIIHVSKMVRQKASDKNRQSLIQFLAHKSLSDKKKILRQAQKERE